MGVYIKHWSLADWKELLKWAKIGANNAMIGEFTEVEELPPHGRLIDADAFSQFIHEKWEDYDHWLLSYIEARPTIIEAEGET